MAASVGTVMNGPKLSMYKVQPYHSIDVVTLPDGLYKVDSYHDSRNKDTSSSSHSPLAALVRRQEDVMKKLEQLQSEVLGLASSYSSPTGEVKIEATQASSVGISAPTRASGPAPGATSVTPLARGSQRPAAFSLLEGRSCPLDLVISVDPARVPLSLVILCQQLSCQHKVFTATFTHSSVSDSLPANLANLLGSSNGLKRADSKVVITLIWKKVDNGPQLMVDPTKQTKIQGEANVARFLSRLLLDAAYDHIDAVTATQVDELLDLAQLQLLEGSSKERAAAVRSLNSLLGKRDWLVGSTVSLADVVCWSALHQANQVSGAPANVKRWAASCQQNSVFQATAGLV